MKSIRLRLVALSLVSVLTCSVFAKLQGAEYSPLIEEGTRALIRVDTSKIDQAALTAKISQIAGKVIDQLVEKEEERNQAKAVIPAIVGMSLAQYTPILQTLKENKVQYFYAVPTPKDLKVSPIYFAIPTEGKTEEQLQELRKLSSVLNDLGMNLRYPFVRHGFIFFPLIAAGVEDNEIKEHIKKRFGQLNTKENPMFDQAFARCSNATVASVLLSDPEQIENSIQTLQILKQQNAQSDDPVTKYLSDELPTLVRRLVENAEWVAYNVDLQQPSLQITTKLKSNDASSKLTGTIPEIAQGISAVLKKSEGAEAAKYAEQTILLFRPEVDGEFLLWKIDPSFFQKNGNQLFEMVKFIQQQQKKAEKAE